MRIILTIEASADGYDTQEEELYAIRDILEGLNSSGRTIRVLKIEKVEIANKRRDEKKVGNKDESL